MRTGTIIKSIYHINLGETHHAGAMILTVISSILVRSYIFTHYAGLSDELNVLLDETPTAK